MAMTDIPVDTQKARILVVEDEDYLRHLYVQILHEEGYEVDAAADGQIGYDYMLKDGYDLVLLDVMLPKMDGLTLLEKLRDAHPQTNNKKVVLMTNLGQDSLIARALSLGVQGYLVKSDYTPEQLIQEIKNNIRALKG